MARLLALNEQLVVFRCACGGMLTSENGRIQCSACKRRFRLTNDVIEFVNPAQLSADKRRELLANSYLGEASVRAKLAKDRRSARIEHFAARKTDLLARYMTRAGVRDVVVFGTGAGHELKRLLTRIPFTRIHASDLSLTAVELVPRVLADFDVELGLFTADIDESPVHAPDVPVLVYEALHHLPDMHAGLEALLRRGHRDVFLVEPLGNLAMSVLACAGLAQRVEYSGTRPGRLHLRRLRGLCRTHGYRLKMRARWELPPDYFHKLVAKKGGRAERALLLGLDVLSAITTPFSLGNMAVLHLRRIGRHSW